jgi:hypothetical protein
MRNATLKNTNEADPRGRFLLWRRPTRQAGYFGEVRFSGTAEINNFWKMLTLSKTAGSVLCLRNRQSAIRMHRLTMQMGEIVKLTKEGIISP